jgi:hypothetical protein
MKEATDQFLSSAGKKASRLFKNNREDIFFADHINGISRMQDMRVKSLMDTVEVRDATGFQVQRKLLHFSIQMKLY